MIAEPDRQVQPHWWRQELALLGSYLAPRRLLLLALLLVALAGGLVLAYQFPPAQYFVDVGAADDTPYVINFHSADADGATSFRVAGYYSYITIPGTGSLPYTLTLRLNGSNPLDAAKTLTTTVFVGGVPLYSGKLKGGWQELSLAVNQQSAPAALAARDVVVELRSQTYLLPHTPADDDRGPELDWLRVTPVATGFVAPTLSVLLRLVIFAALLYLLLARLGSLLGLRRATLPLAFTTLAALTLILLLIFAHQGFVVAIGDLLITVAVSYLVLLAARLALAAIEQRVQQGAANPIVAGDRLAVAGLVAPTMAGRIKLATSRPAGAAQTITPGVAILTALITLTFAVKFGGMALPQTIVKDLPWHLHFINVVKAGGLDQLMQPGVLSVTPKTWDLGSDALIPKSPLFYLVMLPLAYLPGDLDMWVKLVIVLIDVSSAVLLYYLCRRLLPNGERIGVLAAAVYLLTPLSYQVLSFGTLPTIFAQWLTLLAFGYLALNLSRLHRPVPLLIESALLALVLLSFPTMVLFTPIVLGVMFVGGFFIRDRVTRRNALLFLPLSGIIAAALAVLIYYGRYIVGVLTTTLPAVAGGTKVRGTLIGERLGGWGGLLVSNVTFYGSVIPFILALTGLILIFSIAWSRTRHPNLPVSGNEGQNPPISQSTTYNLQSTQPLALLLLGWLLILPLFYVANYWLDMIGKHLLYAMYPLSLASGITLAHLYQRGQWGRWLVWLLLAALAFAAGSLWLNRILYAGR